MGGADGIVGVSRAVVDGVGLQVAHGDGHLAVRIVALERNSSQSPTVLRGTRELEWRSRTQGHRVLSQT